MKLDQEQTDAINQTRAIIKEKLAEFRDQTIKHILLVGEGGENGISQGFVTYADRQNKDRRCPGMFDIVNPILYGFDGEFNGGFPPIVVIEIDVDAGKATLKFHHDVQFRLRKLKTPGLAVAFVHKETGKVHDSKTDPEISTEITMDMSTGETIRVPNQAAREHELRLIPSKNEKYVSERSLLKIENHEEFVEPERYGSTRLEWFVDLENPGELVPESSIITVGSNDVINPPALVINLLD